MLESSLKLLPATLVVIIVLGLAIILPNGEGSGTPKIPKPHSKKLQATPQSIKSGEAIYKQYCKQCHGARAIRSPKAVCTPKFCPADLRCPKLWKKGDDFVYKTITDGRPPMPRFGKTLSDKQRRDVVNYLHSLMNEHQENSVKN